jgi:hypothetical protein
MSEKLAVLACSGEAGMVPNIECDTVAGCEWMGVSASDCFGAEKLAKLETTPRLGELGDPGPVPEGAVLRGGVVSRLGRAGARL